MKKIKTQTLSKQILKPKTQKHSNIYQHRQQENNKNNKKKNKNPEDHRFAPLLRRSRWFSPPWNQATLCLFLVGSNLFPSLSLSLSLSLLLLCRMNEMKVWNFGLGEERENDKFWEWGIVLEHGGGREGSGPKHRARMLSGGTRQSWGRWSLGFWRGSKRNLELKKDSKGLKLEVDETSFDFETSMRLNVRVKSLLEEFLKEKREKLRVRKHFLKEKREKMRVRKRFSWHR